MTKMSGFKLFFVFLFLWKFAESQLDEEERLKEYAARGYTWPLEYVNPNTEGWRHNMFRRLAQVERIQEDDDRYNGWVAVMVRKIALL